MQRKDSSEYGWLTIRASEYERMHAHEYAGTGTPLNPDAPGFWAMTNENGAAVLYTGLTLMSDREASLTASPELGRKGPIA